MNKNTTSWAQDIRLKGIETLSYWTGRINTTDLIVRFGISRMVAQKDITRYLSVCPGNLSYSRKQKAYLVTSIFKPVLTSGHFSEYLTLEGHTSSKIQLEMFTEVLPPLFCLDAKSVRPVINAILQQQGVRIFYRSINHPDGLCRDIYPHNLINSGFRSHVRAYCQLRKEFRDFNLARIVSSETIAGERPLVAEIKNDTGWENHVELVICPNPHLGAAEKALISHEFNMINDELVLNVRAVLIPYTLQIYQIETDEVYRAHPERYRLIVKNIGEIKDYLWNK